MAVAIGSNVGDRGAHLAFAVERLASVLDRFQASSVHETDPVGVAPQRRFLNGAVVGVTGLSARDLLDALLAIERARGRVRPYSGAPRTLDLDLILYGEAVIDEPGLRVPHPRFREREFVLGPLAEIAGDWVDPETGKSVRTLLEELRLRTNPTRNDAAK